MFLNVLLVVVLFAAFPIAAVLASKGDLARIELGGSKDTDAPLYVTLGKADLIDVGGSVADVLVANPNIIDVMAVQANKLYVVGVAVGDTNLIVLNSVGDVIKRIDVHVTYDLQAIQSLVNDLFPEEDVHVGSIHDQVLLTGTVSTPESASKIVNIVGHYVSDLQDDTGTADELISNLLDVRGEQQVMLQVKIVEATRNVIKELGVETNANDPNELSASTIFGQYPNNSQFGSSSQTVPTGIGIATGAGIALSQDAVGVASFLFDSKINGLGSVGLFLNALEEEDLANILAEPNLTTVSGETAGFLAGGEFPVPTGRDQVGNIVIEFREFGVSLNFRPIVLSEERISLQMNTEVSSLDFDNAVVLANITVPGRDIRRVETTVEMPSGASLMIAGLLSSDAVKGMSGLPGIANTPVLGKLVSSDSFRRDETELVIIVTPYLVEPYAETERSDHVPEQKDNPLAQVFVMNIRRVFDLDDEDEEMFAMDKQFGYLLD